jgi:photosystem II stability/assembly factor-like uncharacterized protein
MRCRLLTISFIMTFTAISFPQNSWMNQNSGTSSILQSVYFIDQNNGWISGAGPILHTTDGGQTWSPQTTPPLSGYYVDVYFTDTMNGWACGNEARIIQTSDGGNNWVEQPTSYTYPNPILYDIYFVNPDTGWAVGGDHGAFPNYVNHRVVLYTTNGGNTWSFQLNQSYEKPLVSVSFTNSTEGYAAGEWGGIIHTSNGGSSWLAKTPISSYALYGVYFADSSNGWVSGEFLGLPHVASISKTTDGGNTWQTQTFGTDEYLRDIYFVDSLTGWAVGGTIGGSGSNQHETILHTTDGGATWQMQASPSSSTLLGVSFVDANDGWAVGVDGTVLTTSNPLSIEPVLAAVPSEYALLQNYPNPFNPETNISFAIPKGGHVTLEIYNPVGQKIKTLENGLLPSGRYNYSWNGTNDHGSDVVSGVYFYKLQAGEYSQIRKMVFIK